MEAGKAGGFSLHAGVSTKKGQRKKLERLCRYVSRPAVSEKRLSLTQNGQVRYELKTPYRDGTTHVIFDPLDFIARLVALIPKPRVNLARYHGVFAPNSRWRDQVTPENKGNRRRLGYLGKFEFTDSIAGIGSTCWQEEYCPHGCQSREFGEYFRVQP